MSLDTVKATIWAWASAAVNRADLEATPPPVTVYWDKPDAPRPQTACMSLRLIMGPTRIGHDEQRPLSSGGDLKLVGTRKLRLSCNAYSGQIGDSSLSAHQIVSDLLLGVSDPRISTLLGDLSVHSFSDPRDLSNLVPGKVQWDERVQIDVEIGFMEEVDIDFDTFDSVSITSDSTTDSGETIETSSDIES